MTALRHVDSPLGILSVAAENGAIARLHFGIIGPEVARDDPVLVEADRQLHDYFAGALHDFDLKLHAPGNDLERGVWDAMRRIPYGRTRTYGEVATELSAIARPTNARNVGTACGANPIAIVIPCHRIVGAGGKLTGYSGGEGIKTKAWLLGHEGWRPPSVPEAQLSLFG